MKLALKVDVDTYDGMRDGIPNFLALFRELGISASFYIPFGPDESGKAIFRVFKKKGFLRKMFRTNALKLYGIKTVLRGTLLPAPKIGSSFPQLSEAILREGHELGIHGYNHVEWQDHLLEMPEDRVRAHLESGIQAYEKVVGKKPEAFAAPAWLCSGASLKLLDDLQFRYASDTRGAYPFLPSWKERKFNTLQIPSTLPTADELLGTDGLTPANVHDALTEKMKAVPDITHVHTVHTEVEGTAMFTEFSLWVRQLKKSGVVFQTLASIASATLASPEKIHRCAIELQELPGRAGPVACQIV